MKQLFFVLTLSFIAQFCIAQINKPDLSSTSPSGAISNPMVKKPQDFQEPATPKLNYQRTWIPQIPVTDASLINENADPANTSQVTNYVDGMGQEIQSIMRYGTSNSRHTVSIIDPRGTVGNKEYSFLPYSISANGNPKFRYNAFTEQENYHSSSFPNEGNTAYSETENIQNPDGSMTNFQYGPGKSFVGQKRGLRSDMIFYNGTPAIKKWELNANGIPEVNASNPNFLANELMIEIKAGQHGQKIYKYLTLENKLIATSVYSDAASDLYETTYNVYDEFDRITVVITPKATSKLALNGWVMTTSIFENLCNSVKFDELGRAIKNYIIDKEESEEVVYDKYDRPCMWQDPNLRTQNKWMFSVYDDLGRKSFSGLIASNENRAHWQYVLDGTGSIPTALPNASDLIDNNQIYTYLKDGLKSVQQNQPYPNALSNVDIMSYNYYDRYTHPDIMSFSFDNAFIADLNEDAYTLTYGVIPTLRTMPMRGMAVATKERVIKETGSASELQDWLTTVMYYNNNGEVIQTQTRIDKALTSANQTTHNFTDISASMVDFKGRVLRTVTYHKNTNISTNGAGSSTNGTITHTIVHKYEYQPKTFKLVAVKQKINNQSWMPLSNLGYDPSTGQLANKNIGGIENQHYDYNIKGQLTGINASYAETGTTMPNVTFGESIKYDYGFANRRYDGNISGIIWKTPSSRRRAYGYSYTEANRIKNAQFYEVDNAHNADIALNWKRADNSNINVAPYLDFSLDNVNYDYNGNITFLQRKGPTSIANQFNVDQLTYTYAHGDISNRLEKVEDAYAYAPPANMVHQDFQNANVGSTDYYYDKNGNLTKDKNKKIQSVAYSFLNKPTQVLFDNGTKIEYVYTASGAKLEETTTPIGGATPEKRTFIGAFSYKNNVLESIQHAEGKAISIVNPNTQAETFEYNFHIKDHLGNVRTIVKPEVTSFKDYFASHEIAYGNIETLIFDHIDDVREPKPGATNGESSARLDANNPDTRIGTALLLHVMAGDKFGLNVEAYYDAQNTGEEGTVNPSDMMTSIINTLLSNQIGFNEGESGGSAQIVENLYTTQNYVDQYQNILNQTVDASKPRAFLNYLVFDEQMNLMESQSGALQVNTQNAWHNLNTLSEIEIQQGGYLSVYLSNESMSKVVNFDNLHVSYYTGKLMEENHYYPFGMALRISQTPAFDNKTLYQSKELNQTENLNWYDFHARQYDPLLGRFTSVDPMGQFASGYVGMGNNPVSSTDPTGMVAQYWSEEYQEKGAFQRRKNQEKEWEAESRERDRQMGAYDFGSAISLNNSEMMESEAEGNWNAMADRISQEYRSDLLESVASKLNPGVSIGELSNEALEELNNALSEGDKEVTVVEWHTAQLEDIQYYEYSEDGNHKKSTSDNLINITWTIIKTTPGPVSDVMGLYDIYKDYKGGNYLMMGLGIVSYIPGGRLAGATKVVSVIGPRATYREFAKKIGANFLNVTDEAWTMRKNVEFLQGVVKRGDDVIFSGKYNPLKLDPNSVLAQEIRYLQRHGYSWTDDFSRMIKK